MQTKGECGQNYQTFCALHLKMVLQVKVGNEQNSTEIRFEMGLADAGVVCRVVYHLICQSLQEGSSSMSQGDVRKTSTSTRRAKRKMREEAGHYE